MNTRAKLEVTDKVVEHLIKIQSLIQEIQDEFNPEEFEELLVLGAYMRVQKREGDNDEALVTEQDYNRKLVQLVNRYGMRASSGPIKMRNRQTGR